MTDGNPTCEPANTDAAEYDVREPFRRFRI